MNEQLDLRTPRTSGPAEEAIAILIDLAQRGEIDPWDVQVIEVIDRCLSQLAQNWDVQQGTFEADLSQSGQAFLYASMLVLLKADTLGQLEEPLEDSDPTTDSIDPETWAERRLPMRLERHLRRRAIAQPPQSRRVTLQELIGQLQQMAAAIEEKPPRPRHRRPSSLSQAQAARTIAQLAHSENLTEIATQLETFLSGHWSKLPQEQTWLELDQLLDLWVGEPHPEVSADPSELSGVSAPPPHQKDRVGVFWALLLLSAQSKVELAQEEFYQDLKIRALS